MRILFTGAVSPVDPAAPKIVCMVCAGDETQDEVMAFAAKKTLIDNWIIPETWENHWSLDTSSIWYHVTVGSNPHVNSLNQKVWLLEK